MERYYNRYNEDIISCYEEEAIDATHCVTTFYANRCNEVNGKVRG